MLGNKARNEQLAVIINEFVKVSIDGLTIKQASDNGTVFEISGGCICCSAKGFFRENLERTIQAEHYSRIIIEPSGLGGIDMVSEIVGTNPDLCLMPVICLVDIVGIENPRLQLNPIFRMQISKANVIAFSKCDLLTNTIHQERLIEQFKSSFPEKQNCLIQSANLFKELMNTGSRLKEVENKYMLLFDSKQDLTDGNYQEMNYKFESAPKSPLTP